MATVRPLSQRVTETMFQIAAEYEEALKEEIASHKDTLALLQEIKAGNISLDEVAVTDNGWRRIPPEPEEAHGDNGVTEPALVG